MSSVSRGLLSYLSFEDEGGGDVAASRPLRPDVGVEEEEKEEEEVEEEEEEPDPRLEREKDEDEAWLA